MKKYKHVCSLDFPELNGYVKVNDKEVLIKFDEITLNDLRENLNNIEKFLYDEHPEIGNDPSGNDSRIYIEFSPSHSDYWDSPVLFFNLERIETDNEYHLRLGQEIESNKRNQEFKSNQIINQLENLDDKELITKVINKLTNRLSIL